MRPAEFALQLLESEQFTEFSRRGVVFSLFWLAKKAQVVGASTSHWLWGSQNVKTCPGWRLIGLQIPLGLLKSWIWLQKNNPFECFFGSFWIHISEVTFWRVCRCRCWRWDQARTCFAAKCNVVGQRYGHQLGGAFRCFSMFQPHFTSGWLSHLITQLTSTFSGRAIKPPTSQHEICACLRCLEIWCAFQQCATGPQISVYLATAWLKRPSFPDFNFELQVPPTLLVYTAIKMKLCVHVLLLALCQIFKWLKPI